MNVDYWNDIEEEKKKPFFIQNESDMKLTNFLQNESNLQRCFEDALQFASELGVLHGKILEIGSGVCWTTAILSKNANITEVHAVDFSEHRLLKIAPVVFKQLKGDFSKFYPLLGDILHMDFGKNRFDAVLFCQSLYMFPDLRETLDKVSNLLKPLGGIIVACERITPTYSMASWAYWKQKIKCLAGYKRSDCSGNNFYTDKEYGNALKKAGFKYYFQALDYPVYYNGKQNAGNYFGVKV